MTIITKPSIEKAFKLPLPLGFGGIGKDNLEKSLLGPNSLVNKGGDVEAVQYTNPSTLNCIKNALTVLLIFITILLGISGGYFIYRSQTSDIITEDDLSYKTSCWIPYEAMVNLSEVARTYPDGDSFLREMDLFFEKDYKKMRPIDHFREEIEVEVIERNDMNGGFAKIDVPDFKDGRHGRFMHDFKENQSAIIDTTANRCFIMPLDRNTTLPPKSFVDLMEKMSSGYYNIDTERVRRKMNVVLPPVTDLTLISERIANECYDMKVYMLENYDSRVFKREAKPLNEHGKFAEFSGKGIVEFDIINIAEIEDYERQHKK